MKKSKKINSAVCLNCGDILVSKHRHDWVCCTCFNNSSIRMEEFTGKKYTKKNQLTKKYIKFYNTLHGIWIDGGNDYWREGFVHQSDFKRILK